MQCSARAGRRRWLAPLVAALALADVPARAQPPGLELRWPTVAGCPTQVDVEAAVTRLVAGGAPRPVAAEAVLQRDITRRWTLRLTLRDADGAQTRVLTSARCQALGDAAAVILAVAAEPLAVATHVAPLVPAPPNPEPTTSMPRTVRDASGLGGVSDGRGASVMDTASDGRSASAIVTPNPGSSVGSGLEPGSDPSSARETRAPRIDVRPMAPLDTEIPPGLLPAPAPAVVGPRVGLDVQGAAALGPSGRMVPDALLGLSLRWPRVRLQARAAHWFASRVPHPDRADVGVTLRLTAATVRACPILARGPLDLELCGGLEFGSLRAAGDGLADNRVSRGVWAAAVLAAGARYRPLRWLALGLELEGALAFSRHRYAVEGLDRDIHVTPLLGARLLGGLTFIFP